MAELTDKLQFKIEFKIGLNFIYEEDVSISNLEFSDKHLKIFHSYIYFQF